MCAWLITAHQDGGGGCLSTFFNLPGGMSDRKMIAETVHQSTGLAESRWCHDD